MIALECPLFPWAPDITLLSATHPSLAGPPLPADGVMIACVLAGLIWAIATAIILRSERIHLLPTP